LLLPPVPDPTAPARYYNTSVVSVGHGRRTRANGFYGCIRIGSHTWKLSSELVPDILGGTHPNWFSGISELVPNYFKSVFDFPCQFIYTREGLSIHIMQLSLKIVFFVSKQVGHNVFNLIFLLPLKNYNAKHVLIKKIIVIIITTIYNNLTRVFVFWIFYFIEVKM